MSRPLCVHRPVYSLVYFCQSPDQSTPTEPTHDESLSMTLTVELSTEFMDSRSKDEPVTITRHL